MTTPRWIVAAISHLLAASVGVAFGFTAPVDSDVGRLSKEETLASYPEAEAAELAFRFGKPEHARVLLESAPLPAPTDPFYQSAVDLRDLRLVEVYAALGRERQLGATLESLRQRCLQRGWKRCSHSDLRHTARGVSALVAR